MMRVTECGHSLLQLSCTQFAAAFPPTSAVKSAWWLRCAFQQAWLREIQYNVWICR